MSRAAAILNCYGPNGANVAQILIRTDGTREVFGDKRMAGHVLAKLLEPKLCCSDGRTCLQCGLGPCRQIEDHRET